ncbi:MAG: hypothetical protein E7307_04115 [Butyrivibrio sp.]|nr:hypothetical protein [Butyrivibrio sp.]
MNGATIKKLLASNNAVQTCNIKDNADIKDVDFWSSDLKSLKDISQHTLYLAAAEEIAFVRGAHISCVTAAGEKLPALFHEIHKNLAKELAAERAYIRLLKNMYAGESIQSFLDDYAKDNGHFIAVLDISGRILAYSDTVIENTVWEQAVKDGFCDFDFMEHIRSRSKMSRQGSTDIPSVYYCKNKALYYLSNRIRIDGKYVGNVFMIRRTEDFKEQDYDVISTVSRIYSDIIRKEQLSNDVNTYLYGGILGDLLSGMTDAQARSRLRTSGLVFPANMRVVLLRSLQYLGEKYFHNTLLPKLQSYLPVFPYLMHREGLIIVADNDMLKTPGLTDKFNTFCTEQHLVAGVSDCFQDPVDFPEYFEQALSVVHLAQKLNREKSVLLFRDYSFYLLIASVKDKHRLKSIAHPALATLRNYDKEKQASLFETLRTFIACGYSPTEAADALFLHRNTFNYRKKKIEDLCGISLEDIGTRFQLACSYQIFDYLDSSFE